MRIDKTEDKSFATLWIASCIHLHNFALQYEDNDNIDTNEFIIAGQEARQEEHEGDDAMEGIELEELDDDEQIGLLEGKLKREQLKEALQRYL